VAKDPEIAAHQQWLGYVQPVGLLVSAPALLNAQAFLNRNIIPDHQRFLEWVVPVDIAGRRETVSQSVGLALPESVYLTDQRKVQVTVEIKAEGPMRGARGEGASR